MLTPGPTAKTSRLAVGNFQQLSDGVPTPSRTTLLESSGNRLNATPENNCVCLNSRMKNKKVGDIFPELD